MGWDAFGLPAENAAIANKRDPAEWTNSNIENMKRQHRRMAISYDWSREVSTCDPAYYRWNQWFFLKMLERGIAYRKKALVNWCAECGTVLANEQVVDGCCWRHESTPVEQRELEQWFLRITDYADELLRDIDKLEGEWPDRVLTMQRNWIGRSEGAEVDFSIHPTGEKIRVFTTRIDTICGATAVILAPGHPLNAALLDEEKRASARRMIDSLAAKGPGDIVKEGFFTGHYAINPFNQARVPIWVGNFVLMAYGTGAIMAVPGHDERDFEFCKQYGIDMMLIDVTNFGTNALRSYVGSGRMSSRIRGDGELQHMLKFDLNRDMLAKPLEMRALMTELITVIGHEMIHAEQTRRRDITKTPSGYTHSDADEAAYLASPQEANAKAWNIVTDMMRYGLITPREFMKGEFPRRIWSSYWDVYKNPDIPESARKRVMRRVFDMFQELHRRAVESNTHWKQWWSDRNYEATEEEQEAANDAWWEDYWKKIMTKQAELTVSAEDLLPGGLAEGMDPSDFDEDALAEGTQVELEHVEDREMAQEIAMDHLVEDDNYYEKLKQVEAHKQEHKDEGENVGVFLPIPAELAALWPNDRGGEKADGTGADESPPHFTLLYIGEVPESRKDELLHIIENVAVDTPPIDVELSDGVSWFTTEDPETVNKEIAHKGVTESSAQALEVLHNDLREAVESAGFSVKHYADYKPHSTLRYEPAREYEGEVPEGHFVADTIEVWGWSDDYGFALTGMREEVPLAKSAGFEADDALRLVLDNLDDELLHKRYLEVPNRHPLAGHSYVATEALWHLLGGRKSDWRPMNVRHSGESHWYLANGDGVVIDPTSEQFEDAVAYVDGRGKGFLTGDVPSRRGYELIRRVRQQRRRETAEANRVTVDAATLEGDRGGFERDAKRRKRTEKRRRVFRPTWYVREGSNIAFNASYGTNAKQIVIRPGAKVLDMSESALRKSASLDHDTEKLVEAVHAQAESIRNLTVMVERLMALNTGGYDAIQTEDRLIVLNPKAIQELPKRQHWLGGGEGA